MHKDSPIGNDELIDIDKLFLSYEEQVLPLLEKLYLAEEKSEYRLSVSQANLKKLNKIFDEIIEKNGWKKTFFEFVAASF